MIAFLGNRIRIHISAPSRICIRILPVDTASTFALRTNPATTSITTSPVKTESRFKRFAIHLISSFGRIGLCGMHSFSNPLVSDTRLDMHVSTYLEPLQP